MKIAVENPEALRTWLTKTLSPICDADPQALAKYVLALVKKEKEEQELKDVCTEQLDVFLQEKTKEFVEILFVTLKDKSYLPPPPPPVVEEKKPPSPPPPPANPPPAPPEPPRDPPKEPSYNAPRKSPSRDDNKLPTDDLRNRLSHKDDASLRRRSRSPYRDRSPLRNRSPQRGRSPPRRRGGVFDRLDRRRFSPDRGRPRYSSRYSPDRKRRSPPRSPGRRSPGRSPLWRSPGRSPGRRSPGRSPLRRSPGRSPIRRSPGRSPLRRSPQRSPGRRSPLRRSSRSPGRRSPRGRSPLPRGKSPPLRGKSKSPDSRQPKRSDSKTTRSLSRERLPRSRSRTPPPRRRFRPRSWSMSSSGLSDSLSPRGSPRRRSPDSRGSTPRDYSPYNRTTNTREFPREVKPTGRTRCRDYDEKGFCMKGDLCQFDHGSDPVVVDDVNLPNVLQLNQTGPAPPGSGSQPMAMHQRPPVPGQPLMGPGPPPGPIPGPRPHMPPHGPMGPRPLMGGPVPHPMPGARPLMRPGFPGANLMLPKGATPPPPGTVPIRMPPQQRFPQGPPQMPPRPFVPEPYNPDTPAISAISIPADYVPTQIMSRPPQASAHQRLGPANTSPQRPGRHMTSNTVVVAPGNLVSVSTGNQPEAKAVVGTVEVGGNVENGSTARTVLLGKRENDGSSVFSNGNSEEPAHKKPAFDKSRLGPKSYANNTTLELKKIPREMNNIAALNQHFSKFGLITNLQIAYNGDPEAALVSFASPAQAKSAYKCTEPIFNNRFVRVFWHNPDEKSKPNTFDHKPSVKDRLGAIPPAHKLSLNNVHKTNMPDADKALAKTPTGLTKTVFNPEALKKQNVPPTLAPLKMTKQPSHQSSQQQQKANLIAKQQEVLKKKLEIQKKKQQLLQEQLKQQKVLIAKLESSKNISADDRNSILKTIKVLADSIEKLKHELLAGSQQVKPKPKEPEKENASNEVRPKTPPKTPTTPEEQKKVLMHHKQQAQKAILDTELDIINKSYEGADTSELRHKVAKLKEEAMSLGLLGRGRGTSPRGLSFRGRGGRGRGSYAISHVLDRRPKQLVVMGYLLEEKEEVLKHLGEFGEIESVIGDDTVPSVNINFKTRQDAEIAARDGQSFKKKRLVMMWHKPESSSEVSSTQGLEGEDREEGSKPETDTAVDAEEIDTLVVGSADDTEQLEALDEAALLGLDEDEEADTERSWKP